MTNTRNPSGWQAFAQDGIDKLEDGDSENCQECSTIGDVTSINILYWIDTFFVTPTVQIFSTWSVLVC
jgi:hypothetical protein